ncbi:hypothetical protein AJ80_09399 [Polytolypa hystricis UAMH7299]|uniref:MADS-box domain-containing protein n=1 Tax=Polytolypa hystricis (strain UAMH7299) TaxID=1447883 RepID=A0A2B7WQV4_POLH7|nr:hypothetical protein AJ80_09399 [Polytolypa hystricis UAMH7299]
MSTKAQSHKSRHKSRTQKDQSNIQQTIRRRMVTLFSKGVELSDLCDADVFMAVYVNGKFHVLTTDSKGGWLSAEQLEQHYPPPVRKKPEDYRPPQRKQKNNQRVNIVVGEEVKTRNDVEYTALDIGAGSIPCA